MSERVVADHPFPSSEVDANCRCGWERKGWTVMEARAIRTAARRHAANTGHEPWVHVTRMSSTQYRRSITTETTRDSE